MLSDAINRYVGTSTGFWALSSGCTTAYCVTSPGLRNPAAMDSYGTRPCWDWAGEAPSAAQHRGRLLQVRRFAEAMQAEDNHCFSLAGSSSRGRAVASTPCGAAVSAASLHNSLGMRPSQRWLRRHASKRRFASSRSNSVGVGSCRCIGRPPPAKESTDSPLRPPTAASCTLAESTP